MFSWIITHFIENSLERERARERVFRRKAEKRIIYRRENDEKRG